MRRFAQIAVLVCLSALAGAALAFDNGQYENVPPDIRAWFKGVIASSLSGAQRCAIPAAKKNAARIHRMTARVVSERSACVSGDTSWI
jgi:hypothetical protein